MIDDGDQLIRLNVFESVLHDNNNNYVVKYIIY